jgi:lipid II:glycine glycyltransferase (peptidoglycan interpeptide bridge formation enzyme)
MALTIIPLDSTNEKAWDDVVFSSSNGTIFHTIEWLKVVQDQLDAEFLPLMFYKGTQLVAIYPIFIQNQGIIKVALSPPSRSYMLYLGPVIADYESLKQDKKESTYIQVQQEMDKYIFKIKGCKYARIRSSPGLYDSRPLRWAGYTIDPYYTYRIDLTGGIDHVWERFDRKLRVEINKAVREGVTVRTGDKEDLVFIHDSLFKRYIEQGIKPVNYKNFLLELYNRFYPDNLKIFVAEYKGQRIGGTINLCFKNIMYLWVGIPKTDLAGISANDLIQWEAIKWAQTNGLEYYEEMDAGDDPRLRHFKSKYNPDLVIWYSAVKHSSHLYKAGERLFDFIRKHGS